MKERWRITRLEAGAVIVPNAPHNRARHVALTARSTDGT
jgi:hypothetical protein